MTLKLGTSLYSLTNEFHGREYDFPALVREVAKRDLGPGLEVVGYQSIRGFPEVSAEFERDFRALIDETGLVPSCLGINADVQHNRHRERTVDEIVEHHERQIAAAAKLGFPVVRYQFPAGVAAVRRIEPIAARYKVKMGLEIHAPATLDTFHVAPFRELYHELQSEWLGFIPDFGSTARAIPPTVINSFLDNGIPQSAVDLVVACWNADGVTPARMKRFAEEAAHAGISADHVVQLELAFILFGREEPEMWTEIVPQTVHIHGKCFDFDENGDEVVVDYKRALAVFLNGGYDGFMSTEYEGHIFSDDPAFPKLERQHAICRALIARFQDGRAREAATG